MFGYTHTHTHTHIYIYIKVKFLSVDEKLLLKWIFKKWGLGPWIGSFWLRIGTGGRCL